MDSGIDMTDTEVEVNQPSEVVATELETTEDKPQSEATGEAELYVDVEGDQNQPNMSQEQAYAAWKKEKDKRKKKQEMIDKQNQEIESLKSQITELSSVVGKVSKGPKPTLEQFEYDEAKYEQALIDYHNGGQKQVSAAPVVDEKPKKVLNNDAAEFHLYHSEQEITKHFSDYEEAKNDVKDTFDAYGVPGDEAINMMARVAQQGGVDVAKVIYAAKKIPGMLTKLAQSNSEIQLYNLMKEAESKVKVREARKIDSVPEPNINSNGSVDNSTSQLAKAYKDWKEETNQHKQLQKWNVYQAIKKKVKQNG